MTLYLLDTNILIDLAGERKTAHFFNQILEKKGLRLCSSILCIAEYRVGAVPKELVFLEKWLASKELEILYLDHLEIAEKAANFRKKESLSLPDALILATALHGNAHLLTHDQEFLEKSKKFISASDPLSDSVFR